MGNAMGNASVRRTRLRRGLTIWELAVRGEMSISTISAVEKYGLVPRLRTQLKFAEVLGVKAEDLFPVRRERSK